MPTPSRSNPRSGWRARQPTPLLVDDAQDTDISPWEELLSASTADYRLPAPVLDRLIAEALADALPEIAAILERKLRYLIHHEERALLQSCDSY